MCVLALYHHDYLELYPPCDFLYIASCMIFKEVTWPPQSSTNWKQKACLVFVTRQAAGLGNDTRLCVRAVPILRPWSGTASRSTVSHSALWYNTVWWKSTLRALQFKERLKLVKMCSGKLKPFFFQIFNVYEKCLPLDIERGKKRW